MSNSVALHGLRIALVSYGVGHHGLSREVAINLANQVTPLYGHAPLEFEEILDQYDAVVPKRGVSDDD